MKGNGEKDKEEKKISYNIERDRERRTEEIRKEENTKKQVRNEGNKI